MRRAVASTVAVLMMMIGGGASYALLGRHAPHKMELSASATDAPRVETARMFTAPIPPPEPDLIAAKLAPQGIIWPDAPKPVVKAKRSEIADGTKPSSTKVAAIKTAAPPAKPKSKKAAAVNMAAPR